MAFRIDRGNLRPAKRLPDGRVRLDAYVTRTGVFQYVMPDGTIRREYRPPTEVFKEDSLATFAMVPVTDDHPPTMLTAENAKTYAAGMTGETARQDGNYVQLPMTVYDAKLIKKMDAGKVQVSMGYDCTCIETPGISPEGEHYDAIQTNIVANHAAIVELGRAGAGASVRMDGAGVQMAPPEGSDLWGNPGKPVYEGNTVAHGAITEQKKDNQMTVEEALAKAAEANARKDAAEAKAQALALEVETLKGRCDALQSAATQAETARKDAMDSVEPRIRARVALETKVASVLKGIDVSKMDDRAIKVAAIKHLDNADVPATQSDAYVDARFDLTMERASAADQALASARATGEESRADAAIDQEAKARADMMARHKNAFTSAMKGSN